MTDQKKRIASISIVVREKSSAQRVNDILSKHADIIHGRLGMPYPDRGVSIIVVLVDADNGTIGAISGAIGNIPGVTLRSTVLD